MKVFTSPKIFRNRVIRKISVYTFLYLFTGAIIGSVFFFHPLVEINIPYLRTIIIVFASVLLTKYFVYMFLSPWNDVVDYFRYQAKPQDYKPLVSVMIPAWNEEVGILTTVRSLLDSTYTNMEIVVVNDGSTDDSDKIIRRFLNNYRKSNLYKTKKIKIVYHYKENEGKGEALNKAIKLSKGEIVVSIDADCLVSETAIEEFVRYFADPKVMAAVGNVKIGNTSTVVGVVQSLEFTFSFYFKKADSLMNTIYIIGGAAGAFRRELFDVIGHYNPNNITEDIDLSVRIQNAGLKIVYAANALVYTEGAVDLRNLMKQRLRWKRGRFQTFSEFKHLFFSLNKKHNKILSWLILPLAMFGEVQLSLELYFLAFLYIYSFVIHDFSSFISGIIVVSSMFFVQIFFDDPKSRKFSFYMLSPIGWTLFYVATFVEYSALVRSIWAHLRKEEIKWQRWQRTGVHDNIKS